MFAAVPQISSDQGRPGCALFLPRTGTSSPLRRREKRRTSVLGSPLPFPAPAPPPGSSLSKLKRRIRSNLCHEMPGERGEKKGEGCGGGGDPSGLAGSCFFSGRSPRALHLTLPPAPRVLVQPERRVPAICNYSGCFSGAPRCLGFVARAKAKLTKPHHRAVGLVWFSFIYLFFFFSSLQKQTLPSFLHPPLFQLLLEIPNLSTWVSLSCRRGKPLLFLSLGSRNNRHVKGQWASPYKAQNLINFIKGGSVYAI